MPKKNIGVNLDEEELALFEKNRDGAGFESNADFIKARCLNKIPSAQVRDEGEPELETPEEKRRHYRITAVILKNLPISSLDFEELKLYNLTLDAILKTHKVEALMRGDTRRLVEQFEPKYRVIEDIKALPEKEGILYCFDKGCPRTWSPEFPSSRRNHMIHDHQWTTDQLIAVGDL